jgi:hypothetical protein
MVSRPIALAWIVLAQAALAADPDAAFRSVLRSLAEDFQAARALPVGTRPMPPDLELRKLMGIPWPVVRAALGPPDAPDDYDWECHAKRCRVYSYGADERQTDVSESGVDRNGVPWITVITGGPWVLILGVSSNKVVSARWQGQK